MTDIYKVQLNCDERLDEVNENLRIIQKTKGLTFGTDSYLLAAFSRRGKLAAELGGGTGIVSLLMSSKNKCKKIYSAEIQSAFVDIMHRNCALNGLENSVFPLQRDIRELQISDIGGEADCVITNPPYLRRHCGRDNDDKAMNAARRETAGTICDFCAAASRLLKHGGYFSVVYRPDRLAELIFAMKNCGIEPKRMIAVYPSISARPCLVLIEGKKGAAPSMTIAPPLIIYGADGKTYTEDMQMIYDEFTLEHLFEKVK